MSVDALRVDGLVKRYRPGSWRTRRTVSAVDDVDLRVERGEVVGLIGESGSGKTTLVRAALGLVPFDQGRSTVLGQDLSALSATGLRRFRRRVQLLFQNPDAHLNPGLRVRDILTESARLHRPGEPAVKLVDDILRTVGLVQRADALPHQLSGGEKRRVGIAQVLLADPELVVADELTAGLDAGLKADLVDLLLSRRDERHAYLLISHDIPLVAYAADRVVAMFAGRVIEEAPVSGLGVGAHHPYTAALLAAAGLAEDQVHRDAQPVGRDCAGCGYRGPCPLELPHCATVRPTLHDVGDGRRIACHALQAQAAVE